MTSTGHTVFQMRPCYGSIWDITILVILFSISFLIIPRMEPTFSHTSCLVSFQQVIYCNFKISFPLRVSSSNSTSIGMFSSSVHHLTSTDFLSHVVTPLSQSGEIISTLFIICCSPHGLELFGIIHCKLLMLIPNSKLFMNKVNRCSPSIDACLSTIAYT